MVAPMTMPAFDTALTMPKLRPRVRVPETSARSAYHDALKAVSPEPATKATA